MSPKLEWMLGIAAAALLALCGYELLQEHDARVKAESVTAAQSQVIATAQKQIDQAKADQAAAAAQLQARISALEAQKQQPVTAPQFVVDVSKLIPNLPQPLSVVQPPPAQQIVNGKSETLPSAPVVQVPQADLQALQTYKLNCDETGAKLDACTLTNADMKQQLAGTQQQLASTAAERDSWKAAAKGGTWMHRALVAAKWIVVGGAIGYVGGRKW